MGIGLIVLVLVAVWLITRAMNGQTERREWVARMDAEQRERHHQEMLEVEQRRLEAEEEAAGLGEPDEDEIEYHLSHGHDPR